MSSDSKIPVPRLFFREVRNGNMEKAAIHLSRIIDSHLERYPYNEDTLTIYISAHLILTLDLSGYLEVMEGVPVEPFIQSEVHQYGEYRNEPDASLRLAKNILQRVGTFSRTDPFQMSGLELDLTTDTHSGLIRTICSYLDKHFQEPDVTVTTVAERFGLSVSYLSRLFHNATGMKMGEYILMLKFHEAKHLLRTTDLSVTEIAERCGFSGCSAFIRSYRSKEGMTPGAYRRQLQFDPEGNLRRDAKTD